MKLDFVLKRERDCVFRDSICPCPGDSGDIECFFCPECVLDMSDKLNILLNEDMNVRKDMKSSLNNEQRDFV